MPQTNSEIIQNDGGRHSPWVRDVMSNHIWFEMEAPSCQLAYATVPDGQFHWACCDQQQTDKSPEHISHP